MSSPQITRMFGLSEGTGGLLPSAFSRPVPGAGGPGCLANPRSSVSDESLGRAPRMLLRQSPREARLSEVGQVAMTPEAPRSRRSRMTRVALWLGGLACFVIFLNLV